MITLFTGAPGSGKSAACVALLAELAKGRTIYANGIPDLAIPHEVLEDPTTWPQTVPDGSIIVIDEVQRIWRPRGPGQKVPPDISALETHRHRGLDFYIITQGPRLVDSNIRALAGRHVHLRDVGILGRYWYEWPECADNCATAWKNAPIKKRYRLPKAAFALYKSASVHIKPIRSFPFMLVVMLLALVITAALAYRSYTTISARLSPSAAVPSVSMTDVKPSSGAVNVAQNPPDLAASFEPQIPGLAYTALRYQEITKPTIAPYPAACLSMGKRCDCYTQQGTTLEVPAAMCLQIVKGGFFLDWLQPQAKDVQAKGQPLEGNPGQSMAVKAPEPAPPAQAAARSAADVQVLASMAANRRGQLAAN